MHDKEFTKSVIEDILREMPDNEVYYRGVRRGLEIALNIIDIKEDEVA